VSIVDWATFRPAHHPPVASQPRAGQIRRRLQRLSQRLGARQPAILGDDMGGHEGIARAGHPPHHHRRRRAAQDLSVAPVRAKPPAIGDQNPPRAPRQQRFGRGLGPREAGLAQKPRLLEIDVERGPRMVEQRHQPLGLARRGRRDAQIGAGEQRALRDLGQQRLGQIAVQRHRPLPGRLGTAQSPVGQRRQDLCPRGLQRMGVGDRRHQPGAALDRHVAIGRQIGRAIGEIGRHP